MGEVGGGSNPNSDSSNLPYLVLDLWVVDSILDLRLKREIYVSYAVGVRVLKLTAQRKRENGRLPEKKSVCFPTNAKS